MPFAPFLNPHTSPPTLSNPTQSRFEPDAGSFACNLCSAGKSTIGTLIVDSLPSSSTGNIACYPCAEGKYSSFPGDACESCEAGKKSNLLSAPTDACLSGCNACVDCGIPSGGEKSDEGSTACVVCEVGKFSFPFNPSATCTDCEPGKVSLISSVVAD